MPLKIKVKLRDSRKKSFLEILKMKIRIPELYLPFLPDVEATSNSFNDAITQVERRYSFNKIGVDLNQLQLGSNFISIDNKEYQASRWAVESFCKLCKISRSTVYELNPHHLIKLINNIVKTQHKRICILLAKEENKIVNLVKADYFRPSAIDVLMMFQDLISKYSWNNHEIKVCEKGMTLSLTTDLFGKIEPSVGDIIQTGFSISSSDTGGISLKGSLFLFRLECKNGAVLQDKWGEVRWTYDKRMTIKSSLRTFRRKFEQIQFPIEILKKRISSLQTQKITDVEFRKIWRKVTRILGVEDADYALNVEAAVRKEILQTLKEREKENRERLISNHRVVPLELGRNYYEILQRITDKAKDYPIFTKRKLERIGGSIIR